MIRVFCDGCGRDISDESYATLRLREARPGEAAEWAALRSQVVDKGSGSPYVCLDCVTGAFRQRARGMP